MDFPSKLVLASREVGLILPLANTIPVLVQASGLTVLIFSNISTINIVLYTKQKLDAKNHVTPIRGADKERPLLWTLKSTKIRVEEDILINAVEEKN